MKLAIRSLLMFTSIAMPLHADLVADVRASIAAKDFAAGERQIESYRKANGVTPEMILALSWLGRGAQAGKNWDAAERYATDTRKLVDAELKKRKLDAEPMLPLALGASIEVMGHSLAGRGQRTEAVALLQRELKAWWDTSIRTRTQKNLHLLSLEGKPLPALELKDRVGATKLPTAAELKGKPMVLFFWAHWCSDCKQQGPVLERLQKEYASKGLAVLGPTQHYGYVAGGQEAPRTEETRYIGEIRERFYGALPMAVPVSEENFKRFGCSTTPTLVLVDRAGIVRMYHPGKMTYEELQPAVAKLVGGA